MVLVVDFKMLMHFHAAMTANDSYHIIPGNLVSASLSSRRWQRISFNAQQRNLLESVGTSECLDDTDGEN